MDIKHISAGTNPPKDIHAVIEIPLGGVPVKYEIDKTSGALFVDRFLHTAMFYPGNYGFIPHTLSADGDPCDVLVVSQVPVVPGAVIRCRPVGALVMEDEAGGDEKILAVPVDALHPFYKGVHSYQDLPDDHVRADRALLPALQGPGEGQVGLDREMARCRGRRAPDHGGDRAREEGRGKLKRRDGSAANARSHSITLSARSRNDSGMARPSALAVLRLTRSSNLVGCWTGRSSGLAPFRMRST